MSVCVSSALSGVGMSISQMSMMQPLQPHQMAPSSSSLLSNSLVSMDLSHQSHNQLQMQSQPLNSTADPNEPNSDMLLALIARNKSLEGKRAHSPTAQPASRSHQMYKCTFLVLLLAKHTHDKYLLKSRNY